MYKLSTDTRNFSFEAYGNTEEEATAAMRAGLEVHRNQCPSIKPEWVDEIIADANLTHIKAGQCYRDNDVLADIGSPDDEKPTQSPSLPRPR